MTKKIIFGAGCFWGVQFYFDQVPGVISTTVGYSGGRTSNPTYEDICTKDTGHAEVVLVEYDPSKVPTEQLLKQFFRMHDATQLNRQGPDVGDQYRSVIFYYEAEQKQFIDKVLDEIQKQIKNIIATEIKLAADFYKAEDYHQKYAEKTGLGVCRIDYAPV